MRNEQSEHGQPQRPKVKPEEREVLKRRSSPKQSPSQPLTKDTDPDYTRDDAEEVERKTGGTSRDASGIGSREGFPRTRRSESLSEDEDIDDEDSEDVESGSPRSRRQDRNANDDEE